MNTFDAVVVAVALIAVVTSFMSGVLRSLAAILAYLIAAPIAVAVTPRVAALAFGRVNLPAGETWVVETWIVETWIVETWIVLFADFVALGLLISAMLRALVNEMAGDDIVCSTGLPAPRLARYAFFSLPC